MTGFFSSLSGTSFWKKLFRTIKESSRPIWPSYRKKRTMSIILSLSCKTGVVRFLIGASIGHNIFGGFFVLLRNCVGLLFVLFPFFPRLKELGETHRKVEHEIKIAVFTLINEINKKGKALLQQLEVCPR